MITGKDLMAWGLPQGPVFKTALKVLVPNPKGNTLWFSKAGTIESSNENTNKRPTARTALLALVMEIE